MATQTFNQITKAELDSLQQQGWTVVCEESYDIDEVRFYNVKVEKAEVEQKDLNFEGEFWEHFVPSKADLFPVFKLPYYYFKFLNAYLSCIQQFRSATNFYKIKHNDIKPYLESEINQVSLWVDYHIGKVPQLGKFKAFLHTEVKRLGIDISSVESAVSPKNKHLYLSETELYFLAQHQVNQPIIHL